MSPPRVKVYGLVSLTRRQYYYSLVLGLVLLLILLGIWYWRLEDLIRHPWAPYVPLVFIVGVGLEAIEVLIVLRKFNRLEAEQKKHN